MELKTTLSYSGVPDHYIRQLAYYIILAQAKPTGHIIIFRRNRVAETPLEWHTFEFTPNDLEHLEKQMIRRADLLKRALETQDPLELPPGEWWRCGSCSYHTRCDMIYCDPED